MVLAWPLVLVVGALLGVLVGLAGTGGAFIIPALIYIFRMDQLKAQGTALLIAASPVWIIAFLPYYRARQFEWRTGLLLAAGLGVGSYFGAQWVQTLPVALVRKGFAVMLMGLAVKMFVQR